MTSTHNLDPAAPGAGATPLPNHPNQHPPVPHARDAAITRGGSPQRLLDNAERLDLTTFPNLAARDKAPIATIPNVEHLLDSYGIQPRYNVIKKRLVISMPGQSGSLDNEDSVALTQIISLATLNGMPTGQLANIVVAIGDRHLHNPVADWITSRAWDGRDRLPDICATLHQRDDYPAELKETLVSRWMLSAVAAALKPSDFRCRGVLTLQGPQGIGKTAWTKALVSDPELAHHVIKLDHHLDASNKDSLLGAVTHWIVEVGELDGSLKKDIARLKGFLTSDQDKIRVPYGRTESHYARRTVFCASVNDANFLVDTTGNSRWWTIPVQKIDFDHGIDMQQVFAQLAEAFARGEKWWLTPDETERLEFHNRGHLMVSAIRERMLDALDLEKLGSAGLTAMTAIELLRVLGIDQPTNPQCRECASVLRELIGDPKRINGREKWRVPLRTDTRTAAFDVGF